MGSDAPAEPLSVLVVRTHLAGGGADRVTITLLTHLDPHRFRLTLALVRREGELIAELPPGVPVIELGARSLWSAWWPLARLLRREPPQVLLSTASGTNVVAIVAARLARFGGRVVISERGRLRRGRETWKRRLHLALKRWLYPSADRIAAVSRGVRDDLVATLGIDADRIEVVYNPVVTPELLERAAEPVDHPWVAGDRPLLLAVGRLVADKDYPTLLAAFRTIRRRHPARLLILGSGPLEDELRRLAAELGIADDVELAGFDPNPFRYMARATLFVLSSRFEGLPGAMIQAMSLGLPAVATDCPSGPAEIVRDPAEGALVPVGDPRALADAVIALLEDPDRRHRTAEAGRRATARFRVDRAVARYERVLLPSRDGRAGGAEPGRRPSTDAVDRRGAGER